MVANAQVAEFQGESDEVRHEIRCMNTAVDEHGALHVRVGEIAEQ